MTLLDSMQRLRLAWPAASLRTYLVAVILLATVPIAGLMSWQLVDAVKGQQARTNKDLSLAATALAQSVERELASSADALDILAESESLQRGDIEHFARQLGLRARLRPSWTSLYLRNRSGALLFDTAIPHLAPGERRIDPLGADRVLQARDARVSNLVNHDGRPSTAIEVPVIVDGEPRYVLGAWIDATQWQRLIEQGNATTGSYANLFDRRYRLIARTLEPHVSVGRSLPPQAVAAMRGRTQGVQRLDVLDGGHAYEAWHVVPIAGWGVSMAVRSEPLDRAHGNALLMAIGTVAVCLLLGVTLALLLARRMTRPLRRLALYGAAPPFERIAVREIAQLRDALLLAATQDRLARDRLRAKADEFETLFSSSPIGLAFAQDPQCRVVLHNAAMAALFGPVNGRDGVVVLRAGVRLDHDQQPLQRAAAEGREQSAVELEVRIAGGVPRFVIAHAAPLLDGAGKPRGAIGAVVDITERKQSEALLLEADRRLRESQRLVDLAQEAGHVGFFQYQFETDTLAWTPGQAMLFGADPNAPAEAGWEGWVRRVHPDDRAPMERALRAMLQARDENATLDFRVTLPDGGVRWLSSRLLASYASDGKPQQMVGVTVDMTQQKAAERERAQLAERERAARLAAEQANRAKDEFLAMLGHELRNPMSAISSAVEVLGRVPGGASAATTARQIIERQTRHLANLLSDLLDVGRVISGKIPLTRQQLDLSVLVQRLAITLQMTGAFEQHQLELDLQPAWVDGDATRLEQVVSNLLGNATKYTPAGGRIAVRVATHEGQAVLEVADSGVGIPSQLLPRVFDLFVQGERSLDRRAGGLGVGLTLVRRLVELHGGRIDVHSDGAGAGSRFVVQLPALAAPPRPAPEPALAPARRRRIAVVEDNADALEALRSILELDGHDVCTAVDGYQGLVTVLQQRPDIAIVDIGLPGLTGYDVAKRSRAGGYAGRMIAVSGYGQDSDVKQALKSGFDAHMVKPVDAHKLRELLAQDA